MAVVIARISPTSAARYAVQFFFGKLVTLFACELQELLGRLASFRLLHLLWCQVFEFHEANLSFRKALH